MRGLTGPGKASGQRATMHDKIDLLLLVLTSTFVLVELVSDVVLTPGMTQWISSRPLHQMLHSHKLSQSISWSFSRRPDSISPIPTKSRTSKRVNRSSRLPVVCHCRTVTCPTMTYNIAIAVKTCVKICRLVIS